MFVSPCIQLQTNVTCATYFCHVCGQHVNIWEILQCRDQEHMFQFPFAAITFPPLLCKSALLCLLFLNSFCIGKHCARKFFFFSVKHFSTAPSEEFCFHVLAWACRYYTYVRVLSMYIQWDSRFCCSRQALMYIHVHVLRGFPTYILLFSCSLIYSVPFFFASLLHLQCSVCVCLWERRWPLSSRPIPVHVFTCSGCLGLLMLFRYTSSLTESFRNASALLLAEASALALLLVCTPFVLCVVPQELWKSANGSGSQLHGWGLLASMFCVVLTRAVVLVKFENSWT